jgi:hypothetical protein
VIFGPVASVHEFDLYPGAREALFIAPDIVKLDRSLYKYICEPEVPIVEPKEQEDADYG